MAILADPSARLEAARVDISQLAARQTDSETRAQLMRLAAEIAGVATAVAVWPPPGRHDGAPPPSVPSPPTVPSISHAKPLESGSASAVAPPWNLDDLSDLPEDFVEQLGLRRADPLARRIRELLAEAGAPLDTRAIAVACYRRYGERIALEQLGRKLYRMTRPKGRGVLVVPPGLRGRYCLAPRTAAEHADPAARPASPPRHAAAPGPTA